jgi:ureidoacrylate peracid hydrolase
VGDEIKNIHGQGVTPGVTLDAKPQPIQIHTPRTAILVVDMQNDFGAEGGMFHRAGIDISSIRRAVGPTAKVLNAAREIAIQIIYLKMAFQPDLSDLGATDSPNRVRHLLLGVGNVIPAPTGEESRTLIRETWNTDILPELTPQAGDIVLYKHRFSGFYETELDRTLKQLGVKYLVMTGCTTSVCVESTIRDAMFRDYLCVLLEDCTAEPIGQQLQRTNHDASLLLIQTMLGWVSTSNEFVRAIETLRPAFRTKEQNFG